MRARLVVLAGTFLFACSSSEVAREERVAIAEEAYSTTIAMAGKRQLHSAVSLASGQVFVSGGWSWGVPALATTEMFEPATGKLTTRAAMSTPRVFHGAVVLPNGKVLVTGGADDKTSPSSPGMGKALASAEVYDPASNTWSAVAPMLAPRYGHAIVLVGSKVLVLGGADPNQLATAEIYDPALGTWTATGSMSTVRGSTTAIVLQDGRVLVAGGSSIGTQLASAEIYDPSTGSFTSTGALSTPRTHGGAVRLPDGRVLVAGGYDNSDYLATAEIYDPATGTWSPTGSLATKRKELTLDVLPSGVFAVGGDTGLVTASVERYDVSTGTWSSVAPLAKPRNWHTSTPVGDKLLVVGGIGNNATEWTDSELWSLNAPPPPPPASCTHSECASGAKLVASCSACATKVCGMDSYCCNVAWDGICVNEAKANCGTTCGSAPPPPPPPPPSTCGHTSCVSGAKLAKTCSACANTVCSADPYCCNNSWDSICVSEANGMCSPACQ